MLLIYIGLRWHTVATSCDLNAPRCTTGVGRVRVPGRCLRWSQTPPGPRWPPALGYYMKPLLYPCFIRKGEEGRKKKGEVLHLFRCYTHTHPAGAGSTLKGKRKKKADTNDGQQAETAQGGKGTNGPPEPTYAEKRTWQKQSTHLNPTTHYGEARGEN